MNAISIINKIFKKISIKINSYFPTIKDNVIKSNMKQTEVEWISLSIATSLFTFFLTIILFTGVLTLAGLQIIESILVAFILSSVISGLTMFGTALYPFVKASGRESSMNKIIPFVSSHMASMATRETPPINYFRMLSKFKEYGEIREEAKSIVRDVEIFGADPISTMRKHANDSPSAEFSEILWGMLSVIESGSDMKDYLYKKNAQIMREYRRKIKGYSKKISLMLEIYMTLIIVGAIFFIIVSSIISAISPGFNTVLIQALVVFVLIPSISISFMVIIKSVSPVK